MPRERPDSGSPADWLRHATSDLALAKVTPTPQMLLEGLCFHAQQAAEKALKGVLVANSIPFPQTHNIRILLDLLPDSSEASEAVQDAAGLSEYAVSTRYPGDLEPVTEEEHIEAVRLAGIVVDWAKTLIVG